MAKRLKPLSENLPTKDEPLVKLSDYTQIRTAARLCKISQTALQNAIKKGKISKHFLGGGIPVVCIAECKKYWAKPLPRGRPRNEIERAG